jgi:DNA polymerase III alpha subunit
MSDFIHVHAHSEFSTLDGMPRVEEYIIKCNEMNFPALALTEHGNMRSVFQLWDKSKGKFEFTKELYVEGEMFDLNPIKPIFGVEFYMAPYDHRTKGLPDDVKTRIKSEAKTAAHSKELTKAAEQKYKIRKRYHTLAFAMNMVGLINLYKMTELSWR